MSDDIEGWQGKLEALIEERPQLAELQADIDYKLSMCSNQDDRLAVITLMLSARLESLQREFSTLKGKVYAIAQEANSLTEGGYFDG